MAQKSKLDLLILALKSCQQYIIQFGSAAQSCLTLCELNDRELIAYQGI